MSNNPKISVCIPVYNREKYIAQCIESVIEQEYKNIEILISDNCSTDKTVDIISKYLNDKRVRLYRNPTNIGIVGNFRALLNYTVTPWMVAISSDDFWIDKSFLSQAVDRINKYKDLSIFCGGKMVLNENTNIIQDFSDDIDGVFDGADFFLGGLERWPHLEWGAMVIKTSLLKKIHHLDTPGNDVFMFWQLCFLGKIYVLQKPFLMFRNHDSNACRWNSIEDFIQRIILNAIVPIKAYDIVIKKNIFPKIILNKWLFRNLFLFITGTGNINLDNLNILIEGYENMLLENDISVKKYGFEQLFSKLPEINAFENELFYLSENFMACDMATGSKRILSSLENYLDFDDKNNLENNFLCNDTSNSIKEITGYFKNKLRMVGNIMLDKSIKHNLMKSGIDKKEIMAFFNVFVYSKIHVVLPERLSSVSFVSSMNTEKNVLFENIKINIIEGDIFCDGKIFILQENAMLEEVYVLLMKNDEPKFFIETILKVKERLYTIKPLSLGCPKNIEYSLVIPSDSLLKGEYALVVLCIKNNNGIVFYNNEKLII